jgi:hypothetical protein
MARLFLAYSFLKSPGIFFTILTSDMEIKHCVSNQKINDVIAWIQKAVSTIDPAAKQEARET